MSDKKLTGRPKGKNFTILKMVKINEVQNKSWKKNKNTPKLIRDLLEGKLLDTQILKKMIPEFIKSGIELDLDEKEIERVKELHG